MVNHTTTDVPAVIRQGDPNAPGNAAEIGGRRKRRYVLISPCRDEAAHCGTTIDSILKQTVGPALWVIVDDGSTDGTTAILEELAAAHDWIELVRRENRGRRAVGPGVIDAFYAGLDGVDLDAYSYLCKLDLDIDLPADYFEQLMQRMEVDPRIGTCSGKPYYRSSNGRLISEKCGDEMSVGMTKFYRVNCFRQIGGFVREVMWDGIDCHTCRMLGWKAVSWDAPELRFIHLRPMGSSQQGIWTGRVRHGYGQYYMGSSPAFMAASALFRMTRPPYVIGGLGMWWGYMKSWLRRAPRYDHPELRRFLRQYQRLALLHGKAKANERIDAEQAAVWDPERPSALDSISTNEHSHQPAD